MSVHALNIQRMSLIKHGREASNGVSRLGKSLDSYIHPIYEARYQRYPREELEMRPWKREWGSGVRFQ